MTGGLGCAGHECDTDLCKGCTKSLLGAAVAPGAAQCCNMRLRFRQHKRVAMGLSDVAGWGSFLLVRLAPLPPPAPSTACDRAD